MPIRIEDPFKDPTLHLNTEVNPFLTQLREGMEDGSLPILYGPKLKPMAGQWRQEFAKTMDKPTKELVLEIGSHKGEVLKNMALNHKDCGFIGVDITFKRVVTLAQKAKSESLNNIRSLLCNGKALDLVFAEDELDGVVIFFPDPWAKKKRQQKNRLINAEFLDLLSKIVKPGGYFWFKTDHEGYFEQVRKLADERFSRDPQETGLSSEIYTSRFERHFAEQGQEKFEVCWRLN